MITAFGKPSRLKDGMGVVFLVGTALLYAFEVTHGVAVPACGACEDVPAAPAAAPEAPAAREETVRSVDRGPEGHAGGVEVRQG